MGHREKRSYPPAFHASHRAPTSSHRGGRFCRRGSWPSPYALLEPPGTCDGGGRPRHFECCHQAKCLARPVFPGVLGSPAGCSSRLVCSHGSAPSTAGDFARSYRWNRHPPSRRRVQSAWQRLVKTAVRYSFGRRLAGGGPSQRRGLVLVGHVPHGSFIRWGQGCAQADRYGGVPHGSRKEDILDGWMHSIIYLSQVGMVVTRNAYVPASLPFS